MNYQNIFKRYELKYLLTEVQQERLLKEMEPHMAMDAHGQSTIRNIYYDTENYRLIRRSMERPAYKEKLRVRSYGAAAADENVFVELKKKYQSVVYKRRTAMPETLAKSWLSGSFSPDAGQIGREIEYFRDYYCSLHPVLFLSYEREAFCCTDGGDFRMTFDRNILCRQEELSLSAGAWGAPILSGGLVLLEVKTSGAIPLWLTHFLSREQCHKTSFSKYGKAYQNIIYPKLEGGLLYA